MVLEFFKAIIFGIVEGITEWLPVSSTGHLILVEEFIKFTKVSDNFFSVFEVVIQLGAILAVVLIYFNTEEEAIRYASSIQSSGAIDSHVKPYPSPMPGYEHKIIMASPSFTQGSSIELSCDGQLKKPYVLFQQGSLTYEYGKLSITNAIKSLNE